METLYFTYGVLAMIAMLIVAVIVVGIVKVIKMYHLIKDLEMSIVDNYRQTHESDSSIQDRIDRENVEINQRIDQAYSYVDSRFDKLENKLTGNSATKQSKN